MSGAHAGSDERILEVENIEKSFPGVKALKGVTVSFASGTIHAVCGENGAGKSTLMHILAGAYHADAGEIRFRGKPVQISSQHDANRLGISIVYQERSLVPSLTVGENIFAGRQPRTAFGTVDWKRLFREAKDFLSELELQIDPHWYAGDIPPALQQMVEIAKALSVKPQVLILDEPTAVVSEQETKVLFSLLRQLRDKGLAIIYISHRLAEIFQIADVVSVLKDGSLTGTEQIAAVNESWVIKRMVGRDLYVDKSPQQVRTPPILEVRGLSDGKRFFDVDFLLREGEILTFSGLVGAGRTEIFRAVFGVDRKTTGSIRISGREVEIRSPRDAIRQGIGYLPEDRKEQGLFLEMTLAEKIVDAALDKCSTFVELDQRKVARFSEEFRTRLSIATPSIRQKVLNLSGGNQQKVVIAKWLLVNPRILIVDEPTRGVDVGAKLEIYSILRRLRATGTSIIVISSDLPEVLSLSDRIYSVFNGRISGEVSGADATEEQLLMYASGISTGAAGREREGI
jgi:ABC-type sugar transport system ATPase subunit